METVKVQDAVIQVYCIDDEEFYFAYGYGAKCRERIVIN